MCSTGGEGELIQEEGQVEAWEELLDAMDYQLFLDVKTGL